MFDQFKRQINIPPQMWEEMESLYHRMEVPAKTVLLKEGDVSKKAFRIEKGCIRAWFNHDGKDITAQFFFEGEGVSSVESFKKNIPSLYSIETIEPSVLYWIHKKDFESILNELQSVPGFNQFFMNIIYERQFHYMKQFISLIKDSPANRYKNLLKDKPALIQRVPQHYIASYLGITPVSLSRIKNNLFKKKS